jgi:hypothetical protein
MIYPAPDSPAPTTVEYKRIDTLVAQDLAVGTSEEDVAKKLRAVGWRAPGDMYSPDLQKAVCPQIPKIVERAKKIVADAAKWTQQQRNTNA